MYQSKNCTDDLNSETLIKPLGFKKLIGLGGRLDPTEYINDR
jgi:hypothetical protein